VALYDALVLGSSIRAGRWLPEAIRFLTTHQEQMSHIPVAYFTTCLTMVDDTEDNRRTVLAYMEPILQMAPHIEPVGLGLFAGSLDPNRQLLPMLQPDLAPQGDYRDWEAIRSWAEEIRPALLEGVGSDEGEFVLSEAVLRYSDMAGANLSGVELRGADLYEANLRRADIRESDLSETDLVRANLRDADLYGATLHLASLAGATLSGANLSKANLIGADLQRADLSQANLSFTILNGANLSKANLQQTNLSGADLNWTNLTGTNLRGANLREAALGWADLSQADLEEASFENTKYNAQTKWPEDFSPEEAGCILVGLEPR
jgi:uncharacterized protein YjbI with pentapeptide repeats